MHRWGPTRRRQGSALTAVVVGALFALAAPAGAVDLSLPTDTVVYAEPGSLVELGRLPVDAALAGPLCTWQATVVNQDSAHPGNDIIVRSGDSELVLAEVEATEGKVTTNSGSVALVDEVVVTLRMGSDGVFSGGLDLTIRYDQCTTATTATPTTATPTPDGEIEPLGPTVTTVATSLATTTSVDIAPAGPVLPVTGTDQTPTLIGGGIGLVALGCVGILTSRRAAR